MDERVDLLVKMTDLQSKMIANLNERVSTLQHQMEIQASVNEMIIEKLGIDIDDKNL